MFGGNNRISGLLRERERERGRERERVLVISCFICPPQIMDTLRDYFRWGALKYFTLKLWSFSP